MFKEMKKEEVVVKNYKFDCDDNLLRLPTNIFFFNKIKDAPIKEIPISTESFALVRNKVGKEDYFMHYKETENGLVEVEKHEATLIVNVKDYEVLYDKDESKLTPEEKAEYDVNKTSFREFRDCSVNEYFMRDLKKALASKSFAPSWTDFIEACSTEDSAKRVSIITARGQSPETLHKGMQYLAEQGHIKFAPPLKNMFPVSYKGLPKEFVGQADNPSDAKKNIFATIIDRIVKESKETGTKHSIGFSDDDQKTFDVMHKHVQEQVEAGHFDGVEIYLYFTGNKTKERFVLHKKDSVA